MKGKKRIIKIVLRTALLGLIGLIAGLMIYSFNAKAVLNNQMPMPFGYGFSTVLSGSMEPDLMVGDLIVVKETDEFYVGQDVVYQQGNILIVHRIIYISEDGQEIITKGIAEGVSPDSPITPMDIKGEVVSVWSGGGKVVDFIRNPIFLVSVILIIVLIVTLSFKKENKKDDEDLEKIKAEIERLKK